MWNALDAQLRRERDDGEGGKASILHLIARKLAAKALAGDLEAIKDIFDRMDGTRSRLRTRRAARTGDLAMEDTG